MGTRTLVYCHMCGEILDDSTNKQIVIKDVFSKSYSKLFDVCPACAEKIEKIQFAPKKLTPSVRKNPKFTSVIIRDFKPRKSKIVYDVMDYQLDMIKALEINKDDLKLTYQNGRRVYTEAQLEKWIDADLHNLIDAMYMLYKYQTDDEKKNRETKYANNVGFNKPDAAFLTGMCRIYEDKGYDNYHPNQIASIEKRIKKYINQILFYVNTQGIILPGI